jgi:CcdB protein
LVTLRQFDLLRNEGRHAKTLPYFVVVQSSYSIARDLVIVVPAYAESSFGAKIEKLHLSTNFEGELLVLALEEMGAVSIRHLGQKVGNIEDMNYKIVKGLDFLLKGI